MATPSLVIVLCIYLVWRVLLHPLGNAMPVAWKPPELYELSNKGGERRPNDKTDTGRDRGELPTFWCDACEDWYDFHYVLSCYWESPTILEYPRCIAE